ncbi:MAG TPA: ATP-binding protein [Polyangia bacterium]|jgi:two-component system CheB/CheR fusion protein
MTGEQPAEDLAGRVRQHAWLLAVLWTVCVGSSVVWNVREHRGKTLEIARNSALITFENDILYRKWAAAQGGVYVPVSAHTPPNPHLRVPHRDVMTTAGVSLTLVNPAYMARQVSALARGTAGRGHLTSLRPLRAENAPDAWERTALQAFERGAAEVAAVERREGEQHLRLMRPFVTEKGCLKCHAAQGYREGDIRGGISVAVPLAPLLAIERPHLVNLALAHGGLWLLGLAGVVVWRRGLGRQVVARERAERVLRASEAALREADRRKDEFLAMLSHELRNPLTPIHNSLFILAHAADGSDQARRARAIITRQVSHLTHLVDDLLDLNRVTRGKVQLRVERCELGALTRRAAEDHRQAFAAAGLSFDARLPAAPLWVDADPTRLTQVVGNLLGNAAKFTPAGGTVLLTLEAAGGHATLRVRDSGAGIAPELLPRIFEPFIQADRTLDRSKGGLGLGLALVKDLVELHGGTVSAASDGADRGTELAVALPLVDAPHAPAAPAAPAPSRRALRVLVIEDNPDAATSLRDAIAFMGHEADLAGDGPAGIAAAQERAPDVVLCDIGLPEMDGYAVARAFRADAALRSVRLVALTGYAHPEDLARARDAGFDQHLAKPASLAQLREALTKPPASQS